MRLFDSHLHAQHLPPSGQFAPPALVVAIAQHEWPALVEHYADGPQTWLALGVHPQHAGGWCEAWRQQLQQLLQLPGVVAVGEVGLDGGVSQVSAVQQQQALRAQLQLAVLAGKSLILHCHKQYAAMLELLQQEQAQRVGGIVHGFSGSVEVARQFWQLGFGLGIGRVVLNPAARRLPQVVAALPLAALVLESDAPCRGAETDNLPLLTAVAERVAAIRGIALAEVATQTAQNARRLLRLPVAVLGDSP